MHRFAVGFLLSMVSSVAWATEPAPVCEATLYYPFEGATNVSPSPVISFRASACGSVTPTLTLDDGTSVTLSPVSQPPVATCTDCRYFKPNTPLEKNRTFLLDLGVADASRCVPHPTRVRFSTAPAPSVARVRFVIDNGAVAGLSVRFSEEPLVEDLAIDKDLLRITVGGQPLAARADNTSDADGSAFRSFKGLRMPRADQPLRIFVSKQIRFASGASMPNDLDVELVPDQFLFDWTPGAQPQSCPNTQSGCAAAEAGWLALLAVAALRRRNDRGASPV